MIYSVLIALLGVFISGISQVMLKKSAVEGHRSRLDEYLNPLVIGAYALFVVSTLCSVIAFRRIPLSMGPVLDATGYIYVVFFGITLFGERVGRTKWFALALIIVGTLIYSLGVS
ncbi:MAG: EamA family transporter [Atopobiaceae bacterium]|nr:EamA family transporter [Atopobiaceae bacterium]MBQ6524517.1 EamA family transporter [Atopobiaceae bacterium]